MADLLIDTAGVIAMVGGSATAITANVLIQAITMTVTNIYGISLSIFSKKKNKINIVERKELEKLEKELDLIETIKIYEAWMIELCNKKKNIVENSKVLMMAIVSVQHILHEIDILFKIIDSKIDYHKTRWFSWWSPLDFSYEMEEMRTLKKILDNRFTILQQIKLDI
jgi:hypothetical protein